MAKKTKSRKRPVAEPKVDTEAARKPRKRRKWDEVDEASLQSFPASDPPIWIGGTIK